MQNETKPDYWSPTPHPPYRGGGHNSRGVNQNGEGNSSGWSVQSLFLTTVKKGEECPRRKGPNSLGRVGVQAGFPGSVTVYKLRCSEKIPKDFIKLSSCLNFIHFSSQLDILFKGNRTQHFGEVPSFASTLWFRSHSLSCFTGLAKDWRPNQLPLTWLPW